MINNINNNINQCTITPEPTKISQCPGWTEEKKDNAKMAKLPIDPNTGSYAKVKEPSTWGPFQQAVEYWKANSLKGIEFMFVDSDPFAGIDLDDCIDKGTQDLNPDATDTVERFGSYTEFSPSGTGVHIIVKGSIPDGGRKDSNSETNDRDRFFTFTGDIMDGRTCEVLE